MSNTYPVKRAINIHKFHTMKDGGLIDWTNHFSVRDSKSTNESDMIAAKIKTCKYICYRNTISHLHSKYGENAYYQNLDIQGNPYTNFDLYRQYAIKSINKNDPSFKENVNEKYKLLCQENDIVDNENLFD